MISTYIHMHRCQHPLVRMNEEGLVYFFFNLYNLHCLRRSQILDIYTYILCFLSEISIPHNVCISCVALFLTLLVNLCVFLAFFDSRIYDVLHILLFALIPFILYCKTAFMFLFWHSLFFLFRTSYFLTLFSFLGTSSFVFSFFHIFFLLPSRIFQFQLGSLTITFQFE